MVSADELLGHVDERFHHESASSEHVGISYGLSAAYADGADDAVALPGISLATAQSGQEYQVQPEVKGGVSVSQSQVKKVLRLAITIENFSGIAVRRELRGL